LYEPDDDEAAILAALDTAIAAPGETAAWPGKVPGGLSVFRLAVAIAHPIPKEPLAAASDEEADIGLGRLIGVDRDYACPQCPPRISHDARHVGAALTQLLSRRVHHLSATRSSRRSEVEVRR
jgi:hypothetical protein